MLDAPVAVRELLAYRRVADRLFNEDEQAAIVDLIAYEPMAGKLIPGTGGLRKLRVGRGDGGKRGGARIIYYYYNPSHPILLLAMYAKSASVDLSQNDKRELTKYITRVVERWQKK